MIDWNKPIETITGEPARLVYESERSIMVNWPYLVVINGNSSLWVNGDGRCSNALMIRNVPEPPIQVEGFIWLSLAEENSGVEWHKRKNYFTRDGFILNLATVSEKCPEAFERVKP